MRVLVKQFNLKLYVIGALFLAAAVSTIPASGMISGGIWNMGGFGGGFGFSSFGGGFGLSGFGGRFRLSDDNIEEVIVTASDTNECILDPRCFDLDKDLWRSQLDNLNALAAGQIVQNFDFSQLAVNVQRSKKKTEKQKCEATGGTWTVYAYDPGIRQEACIPYIKPAACKAGLGILGVAMRKHIAAVCKLPGAPYVCFAAGYLAAEACEDGPLEDRFLF